jgi:hydrogenase nickel incorporation protein HypA/HybF
MHEFSLAQALLEIVAQEAGRHGVKNVQRVGIKVGAFSHVAPQALVFCFDAVKPGTVAEEAELLVERVPLRGLCPQCGTESDINEPTDQCPQCGFVPLKIIKGRELYVAFLEAEDPAEG